MKQITPKILHHSGEAYAVIQKLTANQHDVLSAIAIGEDGGHSLRTLHSLVAKGLIEAHQQIWMGNGHGVIDRVPMVVTRYTMPIFVHIAWCQYWSEQELDEEET